ncbi:uncharacterized protein LOC134828508 [Culicoides brevitarsis]|uniref:uncharacterized protein LOC134828508 n=1 Tax=Culicoides brevitarsis TaxID=469753 RepID=UPI00307B496C
MVVAKSSPSLFATFEVVLNTINHMLIGCVTFYMTWLVFAQPYSLFSLHVIFCTLGYQLLMAEAILALYSGNAWSSLLLRRQKGHGHLWLQIGGAILALAGMWIEVYNKGNRITWKGNHAIFGLLSAIFLIINVILGFITFWSVKLKHLVKPVYVKLVHNMVGLCCFVFGMVSLYYGYDKGYVKRNVPPEIKTFLEAVCLATMILVCLGSMKNISFNFKDAFKGLFRKNNYTDSEAN